MDFNIAKFRSFNIAKAVNEKHELYPTIYPKYIISREQEEDPEIQPRGGHIRRNYRVGCRCRECCRNETQSYRDANSLDFEEYFLRYRMYGEFSEEEEDACFDDYFFRKVDNIIW